MTKLQVEGIQVQLLVGFHIAYLHNKPTQRVLQERMKDSRSATFLSFSHQLLTLISNHVAGWRAGKFPWRSWELSSAARCGHQQAAMQR